MIGQVTHAWASSANNNRAVVWLIITCRTTDEAFDPVVVSFQDFLDARAWSLQEQSKLNVSHCNELLCFKQKKTKKMKHVSLPRGFSMTFSVDRVACFTKVICTQIPKHGSVTMSQSTVTVFVLISESSQNQQQRILSEFARCKFWWNVPLHLQYEQTNEDRMQNKHWHWLVGGSFACLHPESHCPTIHPCWRAALATCEVSHSYLLQYVHLHFRCFYF